MKLGSACPPWSPDEDTQLAAHWAEGLSANTIAARLSRKGNPNSRVRKAYASRGDDATFSRWVKTGRPHLPTQAELLETPRVVSPRLLQKPWVVAGRSKFHRGGVVDPATAPHVLGVKGRAGILVRLHALGDFFDARYVAFWSGLLDRHPRLAVYGYTAWPPDSPVGRAIAAAKARHGQRFAIRWSNGGGERDCTVPIQAVDAPVNVIVCPEQTGRVDGCGKCGLCWGTTRNIAFVEH